MSSSGPSSGGSGPLAAKRHGRYADPQAEREAMRYENPILIQKGGCGACHIIPGIPDAVGTIGPDLSRIGELIVARIQSGEYTGDAEDMEAYLREAIKNPDAYLAPDCNNAPCTPGLMPASFDR